MRLLLNREYLPNGTNGVISHEGVAVVRTIELPWRNNKRSFSCIPEGVYGLTKRYSERWGWHVMVRNVKDRSFILFHPANDAGKELRGCIALVLSHTGEGKGIQSVLATNQFRDLVFRALERGEEVQLEILSEPEEVLNRSVTEPLWTVEYI